MIFQKRYWSVVPGFLFVSSACAGLCQPQQPVGGVTKLSQYQSGDYYVVNQPYNTPQLIVNDTSAVEHVRVSVCRTTTLYFEFNHQCIPAEYPCGDVDMTLNGQNYFDGYSAGRDDQVVTLMPNQTLGLTKYVSTGISSRGLVSGGSWQVVAG